MNKLLSKYWADAIQESDKSHSGWSGVADFFASKIISNIVEKIYNNARIPRDVKIDLEDRILRDLFNE
jgi:hypothetical protein